MILRRIATLIFAGLVVTPVAVHAELPLPPFVTAKLTGPISYPMNSLMPFDLTIVNGSSQTIAGAFQGMDLYIASSPPTSPPADQDLYRCIMLYNRSSGYPNTGGAPSPGLQGVSVTIAPGAALTIPVRADLACFATVHGPGIYTIYGRTAIITDAVKQEWYSITTVPFVLNITP